MSKPSTFRLSICAAVCTAMVALSCGTKEDPVAAFNNVIPKPVSSSAGEGVFVLSPETTVSGEAIPVQQFQTMVGQKSGVNIAAAPEGKIKFTKVDDQELGAEGYEIVVSGESLTVNANGGAGFYYAIQTLNQLLIKDGTWQIAAGTIRDYPNFAWRGSMLDVARHFFYVEDVKRYIDLISRYKLNVLHLHLSDDQGWRIEIRSWPELTATGGKTQVGGNGGGFYSQEQYKEIVAYAAERFVTIVPEIDLPGHTNAALASYADLNCDGTAKPLYEGIEVGFSTLCLSKEVTFKFVTDVMTELAAITPGGYLHIGGDEAAATPKEDYIQFINKFRAIVQGTGKKMIGWEEVAQAAIDSGVVAQHWHSIEHATSAAAKGAKVILSPAKMVYLDMKYDSTTKLGLNWAAYIEVDDAYNWNPETLVPGLVRENILGIESPLWSETVTNMKEIEYLVFPRLPGVAEVAWSPASSRNWEQYKMRLAYHGKLMNEWGIGYYKSELVPWE